MNIIDLLTRDHEKVARLFSRFEQAATPDRKREVLDELALELSVHAAIEEEVFYPAVKEALGQPGDALVTASLDEHAAMKRLLVDLDAASSGTPDLDQRVLQLREHVEHHVPREEAEVMAELRSRGDEQTLTVLGREADETKERAPTRPHPHAPDQPPAIKVVGRVAAIVDRLRDIARGGRTNPRATAPRRSRGPFRVRRR